MIITRVQYYFLLLAVCFAPFVLYKIGWLAISKPCIGTVVSIGETHGRRVGQQTYPVVQFTVDQKIITAYGDYNLPYAEGDLYPIRYNRYNPENTRLNTFLGCWIDTLIWCTIFTVIVSIVFLVEGIVPRNKLVKLSSKGLNFIDQDNNQLLK
jgi:hypothetical protein